MRHPALTRFFAAFLAALSVLTLISGGICVRKAAEDREKQNTSTTRLSDKAAEAGQLRAELDAMPESFERKNAEYDEAKASYDSEKLSYRKDLSIYTATEAALKQGAEKLEEGYAALRMGWIGHDNGEKALDEAEAQFRPGYEQYLAGKAQLEEGKKQLAEAEKLKENLPDLALLRTSLEALKLSRDAIASSLDAIQAILQDPPLDEETGEIDETALRARLLPHVLALGAELQLVRARIGAEYSPEELEQALAPAVAALSGQLGLIDDGSLDQEELLAAAQQILSSGRTLSGALDEAISRSEQTLTLLENLPEMKAQLAQAEAALREGESLLLQAKAGFDEGRKKLDEAKQALIYAEAQLIAGKKELEEKQAEQTTTKEDLDRRRTAMENESARLAAALLELEEYRAKKDRFATLRYALLADEGISARVRAGEDLIEGAEAELALRRVETRREYALRLAAALLMLAAALCGLLAVIAAFREKRRGLLLLGSALAFALAAAAEGVSFAAGRGMIYTALFTAIFGAGVLALNGKKA